LDGAIANIKGASNSQPERACIGVSHYRPDDQSATGNIAKCRNLRAINLVFSKLDEVEMLPGIARGCPILQKLSIWPLDFRVERELAKSLLLYLFRALPRLEFLALGLKFQMDGALLQDLARHCPHLTVLELPRTQLCISLALMRKVHTFWYLESMQLARIYFQNPRRMMQRDKIRNIATE
jgi:hypothetical protein